MRRSRPRSSKPPRGSANPAKFAAHFPHIIGHAYPSSRPLIFAAPDHLHVNSPQRVLIEGPGSVQLLAFGLSARRLALRVEDLDTIVRAVAITPLPQAPSFVEGVINLRGRVVPVIDLRRRFGLPPIPVALDHAFIVTRGRRPLALRVDQVDRMLTVPADAIEAAERVVPGARHAAGVVRLADGVVVIQDLEALLSSEEDARLAAALDAASSAASA